MKLDREKINLALARKGWTQVDLAEAYGATRQRIGMILNSRSVTPVTVGKMSAALEVDPTEILVNNEQ